MEQFQILEPLGHGKFGKVFKCQHIASKKLYALKAISKKQLKKS